MPESSEEAEARRHAKAVERYWHSKGFTDVRAEVERISIATGEGTYAVRSNLVGGLPQGCTARDLARLAASVQM